MSELGNETCGLGCGRGGDCARVALAEGAPHELDRAAERELGLSFDTARGRCDPAIGAHAHDELVGEPCLPDPCLAVEHREPPLVSDPRVRVEQRRELAVAADERMSPGARARARVARLGRGRAALANGVVGVGGLLGRRDAELAMEDPDAVAVLRERRGALAARAVERDQSSVRGLVERVEGETPSRMLDRSQRVAAGSAAVGEPVEDAAELPCERCGAERLPVVEDAAVAEPESREERAAVQRRRSLEICELVARREALNSSRSSSPPSSETESRATVTQRPPSAERSVESVRRSAARARSAHSPATRARQGVAVMHAALDGEIREQRRRLARVHGERDSVREHDGWPENTDRERHGASLLGLLVTS